MLMLKWGRLTPRGWRAARCASSSASRGSGSSLPFHLTETSPESIPPPELDDVPEEERPLFTRALASAAKAADAGDDDFKSLPLTVRRHKQKVMAADKECYDEETVKRASVKRGPSVEEGPKQLSHVIAAGMSSMAGTAPSTLAPAPLIHTLADLPAPLTGPASAINPIDPDTFKSAARLTPPRRSLVPSKAAQKKMFIPHPEIADYFASFIPDLDKTSVVEINPGCGFMTRALLNRGAKRVATLLSEKTKLVAKDQQTLADLFPDRLEYFLGHFEKLNLDDGCPSAETLFGDDADSVPWTTDARVCFTGQLNLDKGSVPFYHLLYKLALKRSPYTFGRVPMYFHLPRPLAKAATSTLNRLGIMMRCFYDIEELCAVDRRLFEPAMLCSTGNHSMSIHLLKFTPKETFAIARGGDIHALDYISRRIYLKNRTISAAVENVFRGASELLEVVGIDGQRAAESMTEDELVAFAQAFGEWKNCPSLVNRLS